MKDPIRLLDGAASDVERVLLRAAAVEEPPAGGAQRLAAALGLPVGAGESAGAGAGESAGAGTSAGAGAGASVGAGAGALPLKWLMIVGGSVAVAGAVLVLRGGAVREDHLRERAVDSAATAAGVPAGETKAAHGDDAAGAKAAQQHGRSIAREIEQIDAVRGRLQQGDGRAALALLEAYRRDHPAGVLQQEAALLQIEALVRTGERAEARALARRFLREHPGSPHAARVRALAGDGLDAP